MKPLAAVAAALLALMLPAATQAASSDLLFGQQHFYTVTMRGNGEAVVLARLAFTNTADKPQSDFTFEIPGPAAATGLVGFQQQYQQACGPFGSPTPDATVPPVVGRPTILPCLLYNAPNYAEPPGQGATYQKLGFSPSSGNKYKVRLPTPVPAQQSTSLILSYSSTAYAHKSLGVYSFNFQTIKVNQRVASSSVSVSVDSDQYLEGKSSVTYQPSAQSGDVGAQANAAAPSAAALNQISDSIGQTGEIVKSASDLAPGDTLTIKGRYASSALLLRLPELLIVLGCFVLAAVITLAFRRRIMQPILIRSAAHKPVPAGSSGPATQTAAGIASAGNLLAGLVSALGVCGITWFVSWWIQSDASNSHDTVTNGLVYITVILAYLLLAIGPAVYLAAAHRDWRRAVYAVAFEVLFLVAFVLIYAVGIAPLANPPAQPTPVDNGVQTEPNVSN